MTSHLNGLALDVEPLADRLLFRDAATLFVMRSAAATLTWRGRMLRGRLIHEGLATTGLNLLTRRSFKGLAGLEFLYLPAGDPLQPWGNLHLQKVLPGGSARWGTPADRLCQPRRPGPRPG